MQIVSKNSTYSCDGQRLEQQREHGPVALQLGLVAQHGEVVHLSRGAQGHGRVRTRLHVTVRDGVLRRCRRRLLVEGTHIVRCSGLPVVIERTALVESPRRKDEFVKSLG